MAKLAELLAAEKTTAAAWKQLFDDTLNKFKKGDDFFGGHTRSLKLIRETPDKEHQENAAREHKPVITTVYDTLEYALDIYARHEDLQAEKNATNADARGTVMYKGKVFAADLPIDELLGLEARLSAIRALCAAMPTVDATKDWIRSAREHCWVEPQASVSVKTEKQTEPLVLSPATKEHPANTTVINRDVVVGAYSMTRSTGAASAEQKADLLKSLDELLIEIKQARQRANETPVVKAKIGQDLRALILNALHPDRT